MNERPQTEIAACAILAQRVLDMFAESGTTPKEQKLALDIVRDAVLDRLYGLRADDSAPRHFR